jgi:Fur family ferric uptake transcriptional regulator
MDGTAYFGLADHHHDHIVCERCGVVEAMEACLLGPLEGVRLAGSDFLVTGHRLDLRGLCRMCQEAGIKIAGATAAPTDARMGGTER